LDFTGILDRSPAHSATKYHGERDKIWRSLAFLAWRAKFTIICWSIYTLSRGGQAKQGIFLAGAMDFNPAGCPETVSMTLFIILVLPAWHSSRLSIL
jgi:hypothetical protein